MTNEKRQGAVCRKGFRQICFLPHFCVSAILSKVWISARQFSVLFSFGIFLFLEAVVKAALFVVEEVGAIQVVINPSPVYLHHLRLACQSRRKSTRLPVRASPKGRLRTFPFPSLSSIGGFYTPALLTHTSTYLIVWHTIRFFTFHPNLSLFRLPPFRCGLHRIASVGRPRSGAKVIPGCYAAARSVPSVLEKISTPTLHCVLFRVVFSLKNLAFAHPYLCEAPETKTTDATGRRIKKNVG